MKSINQETPRHGELPIDGPWSILKGQYRGKILIVRLDTGYRELGSVPGYGYQVGIVVPLRNPESSGLPSFEENAQLDEIEESIGTSLEAQTVALFVAVITTGGMREFLFYTRAHEEVRQRFETVRTQIKSHKIQLMIEPDESWTVYRQLS